MAKTVIVKGGDSYKLEEVSRGFVVYAPGLLVRDRLGETRDLEDALAFIKNHSGKEIKEIK